MQATLDRHRTNPFATRHTRPGALPPLAADGRPLDVGALLAQLDATAAAAIEGPHGTGKSTMLAALAAALRGAGRPVRLVQLRRRRDALAALAAAAGTPRGGTLCIDGWERTGRVTATVIRAVALARGYRLLVTSHGATGLTPLARTSASRPLLEAVVARLPDHGGLIGPEDVAAAYASHPGNLRDALDVLYDRFERRRRS